MLWTLTKQTLVFCVAILMLSTTGCSQADEASEPEGVETATETPAAASDEAAAAASATDEAADTAEEAAEEVGEEGEEAGEEVEEAGEASMGGAAAEGNPDDDHDENNSP